MKRLLLISLLAPLFCCWPASVAVGQASPPNRYEVELLANPNPGRKDTRQVNSVIVFEKDSLTIASRRRKNEVFKQIKYAEIKSVEHSFSKFPFASSSAANAIIAFLAGSPRFFQKFEKHWLMIVAENDFAVLKLENDNYRLIKAEFEIRDFQVEEINENKPDKK
jgi:hypothetical protein